MAQPITTDDMVTQVRDQLDENNTTTVSDSRIIRALNRGARNCYKILAKQFDQLYMAEVAYTTDGTNELTIPANAFGRRVEFITYTYTNGQEVRVDKVSPGRMSKFNTTSSVQYPRVYTTIGDKIKLGPTPVSGVVGTITYMKKPGTLFKSQGRILSISGETITVDSIGVDLSTAIDDLSAFVNIVDRDTGVVKGSLQIQSINTDASTITFKATTPDRTSVYGTTIDTAIAADIAADDYVCGIGGTCVLEMISDHSDYPIQHAVVEIKRSLGLPTGDEYAALKGIEEHVVTAWAGRESDKTVARKNPHWGRR